MMRKLAAELLGTGLLVFFGVGVATLMFGFKFDGGSVAAGVVATALPSVWCFWPLPIPSGRFRAVTSIRR
jgi:glycerol uptake facilitator-like aquaporin